MTAFGSPAWGAKRQGKVSAWERAGMVLTLASRRVAARLAHHPAARALNFPDFNLPDSRLAKLSLAQAEAECDSAIVQHCLRTYAWGLMLGAQDRLTFDRESFAIAALLHDLELGRTSRRARHVCACFACASSESAGALLEEKGAPPDQIDLVCDAIARHLNPDLNDASVVARLLGAGAAMDVVGAGLQRIAAEDQAQVLAAFPRTHFKRVMIAAMTAEAKTAPSTRAGVLVSLGFGAMIARAPFKE